MVLVASRLTAKKTKKQQQTKNICICGFKKQQESCWNFIVHLEEEANITWNVELQFATRMNEMFKGF